MARGSPDCGWRMALKFEIKPDLREVKADLKLMDNTIKPLATRKALNDAAKEVITVTAKEVAAELEISPLKNIRSRIRLNRATLNRSVAEVVALELPLKVSKIGKKYSQTPAGASVKSHFFPGAFVATMKSGHKSIFKRMGKSRLPIEEVTVDVKEPLERRLDENALVKIGPPSFERRFDEAMKREMRRRKVKSRRSRR